MSSPTYRLRFFFDYNCGGCLWCDNDAAYQKFDVGPLDAEMYDLNGNVINCQLPSDKEFWNLTNYTQKV